MLPSADSPFDASADAPLPASAPTLAKWPFVLGDALLLLAALGLWSQPAPLSALATLLCLGAVGLGAALFVLPFVMEFITHNQLRGLELEQARAGDFQRLAGLEAELRKQARLAAEAQEQTVRAVAALEASARRFDARLAPLAELPPNLAAAAAQFHEAAARQTSQREQGLEREIEQLRESQSAQWRAAVETLAGLARQWEDLLDRQTRSAATTPSTAPAIPASEATPLPPPEETDAPSHSHLAKALATTPSADESSAVSRIIQARARRPRKTKLADDAPDAPVPAAEPAAAFAADSLANPHPSSPDLHSFPVLPPSADSPSDPAMTASAPAETAAELPAVASSTRAKVSALFDDDEPTASVQSELLAPAPAARRRAPKPAGEAPTLVARILIGIGNKPYVRGHGPGLSPDKGVPMEFVEIGKWQWVAPAAAKDPITLRLFKNDETPATGDPLVLQPGQILDVSPVFPG